MTILIIFGILAVCYLLLGEAGIALFWAIIRWPLVIILFIGALANLVPLWLVFFSFVLAMVDPEKIPEEVWDWANLFIGVVIFGGGLYLLLRFFD